MEKTIKELLNFGIIVIDKPAGPTSFSVSDFIRKQLGLNKTSHFGTLDPQVTGVLPIALGRACKLTGTFLGHDKTYVGILHTHKEQNLENLKKIINEKFTGVITQIPPKKSRVKRVEREREIKKFEILEESMNKKDFLFIAEVQGGTYIRKLCSDLGEIIGGAHMLELRRTRAGIFGEEQIISLYDFEKALAEYKNGNSKNLEKMIIPAEKSIKEVMETIQVDNSQLKKLLTGKPLFEKDILGERPTEENFALFSKDKFIGLYKKVKEKDIFARSTFVFN